MEWARIVVKKTLSCIIVVSITRLHFTGMIVKHYFTE